MERKGIESIEQIFEDHGGEEAIIDADDSGLVQEQRVTVETEIDEAVEGDVENADEGGEDNAT